MQNNTNALLLLEQARGRIESSIFTRFFTRPVLVFFEIVAYIMIVVSAWLSLHLWATVAELAESVMEKTVYFTRHSDTSLEDIMNYLNLLTLLIAVLLPVIISL